MTSTDSHRAGYTSSHRTHNAQGDGGNQQTPYRGRHAAYSDDDPTVTLTDSRPITESQALTDPENISWLEESPITDHLRPAVPADVVAAPPAASPYSDLDNNTNPVPEAPLEAWEVPPATQQGVPMVSVSVAAAQRAHFGRLQVLPGLMGWMVSLSTASFLAWLAQTVLAFDHNELTRPAAEMLYSVFSGDSRATVGLATMGSICLLAYLVGGYTAGRMARFAGAKQGVAVWLWQIFGYATATILTYVMPQAFWPGSFSPLAAQQFFGNGPVLNGALAIAGVLVISLTGAVLGGMCGRIYHRRVDRYPKQ